VITAEEVYPPGSPAVVDGQVVLIDPEPTSAAITIVTYSDEQPIIVRLSLDDLQRLRRITEAMEKFGDKLASMPQEDRMRITPYGLALLKG
jgi:hypothetical protein